MQAQMTPATAPGIAGLMQGKPQSPTAGLGNVPQRIGAYGEQGLAQKNAVTQDLLDLMAAQKLKAEKEAAARQMQLQAAQQGQPLTVAQSLDKELLDMTKQELAPQQAAPGVAQASQQQAGNQKAAMDRLMAMASQGGPRGIPQLPGADQVMPQRMAGGGIVAFQNRGEVPPSEDETGLSVEERIKRALARLLRQKPEEGPRKWEKPAQGEEPDLMGETLIKPPEESDPFALVGRETRPQAAPPQAPPLAEQRPQAPPLAEQRPPAPPIRPSGPGIRGLGAAPLKPQGIGQGISVPQESALPQGIHQAPAQGQLDVQGLLKQTGMDEEARAAAAMERAKAVMARSPEEEKFYSEKLARLQKREPDKRWYERLADLVPFLGQQQIQPGQQGIIGGLGRIASAGVQMDKAQKAMADQRQAAEDAFQEAEMKRRRDERLGIYQAGEQARAGALEQQIKRGQLGAELAGVTERRRATDVQAATAMKQIASQEQVAAADRDVRLEVANIQAAAARGDDRAKRAVEQLKTAMDDPLLKKLAEQAAVNPKKSVEYNARLEELIKQLAPEFAKKPAAPAAGQKVIDFASIGAK